MILGLVSPTPARSRCSDADRATPCARAGSARCCRAGRCSHDATVIDVLRLMHGLHAHPLPVAEVDRAGRPRRLPEDQDRQALRRPGAAAALRPGAAARPRPADPGRADRGDGRRGRAGPSGTRCATSPAAAARCCSPPTTWTRPTPFADRIVVLAEGRVVADGTGARDQVPGGRPDDQPGRRSASTRATSAACPASSRIERVGARLLLHTTDSDATLRALLARCPQATTSR